MRDFLRNTVLNILGSTKSIAPGIHILNSHYVSPKDVPAEIFHDLLKKLKQSADFIKIEEAMECIQHKKNLDQKLIAFTFDDGFEECYTKIAPVLNDFNTNAAFFINPGFINGNQEYKAHFCKNIVHVNKEPMSWEMIKELHDQGFIIGNHTYDHAKLVNLSAAQLQKQLIKSKKEIEFQLNSTCNYFAWTYGKLSDIDPSALDLVLNSHQYVFSSDNYTKYFSYNNQVFNRRHIEGNWPVSHVKYFLSTPKSF